jgi:hypothetical protein
MAKGPRPVSRQTDPRTQDSGAGIERDQIARRAYERYEARGRGDGQDLEDWYEAEQELQRPLTARARGSMPGEAGVTGAPQEPAE